MRVLVILLLLTVAANSVWAQCADNILEGNPAYAGGTVTHSTNARGSLTNDGGCRYGQAAYDLVAGNASVYASGTTCPAEAAVVTHDSFTLHGSAPAGSFAFHTRARITLNSPHCGSVYASVMLGSGAGQATRAEQGEVFTENMDVPTTGTIGGTFDVLLTLDANVGGYTCGGAGTGVVELTFPDLPAGATVTSCQGYLGPLATTVKRDTWGRLKASYR
jgi:hypothetical protein